MNAELSIDGRSAGGCARHLPTPVQADWSDQLFDSMPALRSCLARAQADTARVDGMISHADGTLELAVIDADGSRFTCSTAKGGRLVAFAPAAEPAAPATPAFARSAAAFASMTCDEAPIQVVAASGETLGYWQSGHCGSGAASPTVSEN